MCTIVAESGITIMPGLATATRVTRVTLSRFSPGFNPHFPPQPQKCWAGRGSGEENSRSRHKVLDAIILWLSFVNGEVGNGEMLVFFYFGWCWPRPLQFWQKLFLAMGRFGGHFMNSFWVLVFVVGSRCLEL